MVKKSGKVYNSVRIQLRLRGTDAGRLKGLEIATLGRGTDHLVLLDGETVGEYNHVSRRLVLYSDVVNTPDH